MENKLMIAGFGGQGVMLMGQLLGFTAQEADKNVTYYPSYGPEQRGGTANCTVVISDDKIASPMPAEVDVFIAMNQPSLDKYKGKVRAGGVVIINTSHAVGETDRDDVTVYALPADDIAREAGSDRAANMVMLGAYLNVSKILAPDQLIDTMKVQLARKAAFFDVNQAAINKGIEAIECQAV
ncbi:MAG: 2-oxoacid:acceptor oxidoreductase family protein [Deltaproteobacteria bacterium]|nr:2-oxoacid:acceptor oxidoreductase family protein [Deltaproteobacteria bacterium]